jgi:hypothetical protein
MGTKMGTEKIQHPNPPSKGEKTWANRMHAASHTSLAPRNIFVNRRSLALLAHTK